MSVIFKAFTLQAMLKQEMGWYDQEKNNTGALCARLSTSAEVFISDLILFFCKLALLYFTRLCREARASRLVRL